jgi:hypothetical protein
LTNDPNLENRHLIPYTEEWYAHSSGRIDRDYTIESCFIPIFKGGQLLYKGTIGGPLKSIILKGASKRVNYYTAMAAKMGYSTKLAGLGVKAPTTVQIFNNLGRVLTGKPTTTVVSNSMATVIGRTWQAQAINQGLLMMVVGPSSLFFNISND